MKHSVSPGHSFIRTKKDLPSFSYSIEAMNNTQEAPTLNEGTKIVLHLKI